MSPPNHVKWILIGYLRYRQTYWCELDVNWFIKLKPILKILNFCSIFCSSCLHDVIKIYCSPVSFTSNIYHFLYLRTNSTTYEKNPEVNLTTNCTVSIYYMEKAYILLSNAFCLIQLCLLICSNQIKNIILFVWSVITMQNVIDHQHYIYAY